MFLSPRFLNSDCLIANLSDMKLANFAFFVSVNNEEDAPEKQNFVLLLPLVGKILTIQVHYKNYHLV